MTLSLEKITNSNQKEACSFLSKYSNTAIFLLGNLHEHGPNLGPHVNSGNFKLIRQNGLIVCVFCLTKRGNLLVQSELIQPVFELIINSCKEELIAIRGIIGDWKFAEAFWKYLKGCHIIKKEVFYSKEVCYSLDLNTKHPLVTKEARHLKINDFESWILLRKNYLIEQNLPINLTDEEIKQEFSQKCSKLMSWGLFSNRRLLSVGELNAKTDHLAVVGGVYTVPEFRGRGFAKALMERLIFDCKNKLNLHKLIIFTGENENIPAQKLYESVGSQKIGYMALLFGE